MERQPTLPTFGEIVPGEGGRLGAIMRGALVDGVRQADYAVIVPDAGASEITAVAWGSRDADIPGANSLTDGRSNTQAMLKVGCLPALRVSEMRAEGHQDLYIPACAELWALCANVPELFLKKVHWSSTQNSRTYAIAQGFENGLSLWSYKAYEFRVRAVRAIPLQHFPT